VAAHCAGALNPENRSWTGSGVLSNPACSHW